MRLPREQQMLKMIFKARRILNDKTPKKFDCGQLCSKACCKGNGEIWLLPYEDMFYENNGFGNSHGNTFSVKQYNNNDGTITKSLICEGSCDNFRDERPFWCRIFPCFPLIKCSEKSKTKEKLSVNTVLDIRGNMCPLIYGSENIEKDFARAVSKSVFFLCKDDEMYDYFLKCSEFYEEIIELFNKLYNERKNKTI